MILRSIIACLLAASALAEERPTLAVLPLQGTNLKSEELQVLDEALRDKVTESRTYRVQDRAQMEEVLEAQKKNASEACDESCQVEAGRLLQVAFLASGTVRLVGNSTWISIRLTNVETGEVAAAVRETCKSCVFERVVEIVETLGGRLVGAPEAPPVGTVNTAVAQLVARGKKHDPSFGGDDADKAAGYYYDALQRAPQDPEVLGLLGSVMVAQGKWRQALPNLKQAAELDPANAERWMWLGAAMLKLELGPASRDAYERAARLLPEDPRVRAALGHARLVTGDARGAVSEFRAALQHDPDHPQAKKGMKLAIARLK